MWRRAWFGYIFIALAAFVWILWYRHIPPPSYAVVVMGIAAGIMALRPDMPGRERWLWTVVLFAFAFIEFKAINDDRYKQDEKQKAALREEREHFGAIGTGIESAIQKSDEHFQATMSSTDALIDKSTALMTLSKENIDAVTGGDTFCWILPWIVEDEVRLIVKTVGKSPLHEVVVTRTDESEMMKAVAGQSMRVEDLYGKFRYSYPAIAFLSATSTRPLDTIRLSGKEDKYSVNFTFFSMNGVWSEALRLAHVDGRWVKAVMLTHNVRVGGSWKQVTTYPDTDIDYPRINGQIDWSP